MNGCRLPNGRAGFLAPLRRAAGRLPGDPARARARPPTRSRAAGPADARATRPGNTPTCARWPKRRSTSR